jgi:hypothetical protein
LKRDADLNRQLDGIVSGGGTYSLLLVTRLGRGNQSQIDLSEIACARLRLPAEAACQDHHGEADDEQPAGIS